jgi:hypothetical protein
MQPFPIALADLEEPWIGASREAGGGPDLRGRLARPL